MLRSEAAQQQQLRGLRSIRLQELVTDLDAEAATWRLLFTLHGIPEMGFPAGAGGPPLHDCGSAQRTSQRIASIVEADPEINRQAPAPPPWARPVFSLHLVQVGFFKGMLAACYRSSHSAGSLWVWASMQSCCRCIETVDMMRALYLSLQSGTSRDMAGSLGSGGARQGGGGSRARRWLGSQLLRARGPATEHERRPGPAACPGHRVTAGSRCTHQVCSCLLPRSSVLVRPHSSLGSRLGSASTGNCSEMQTHRY